MYAILRPETSPGVRQREDEVSGCGIKHFFDKFGHDQISRPRKYRLSTVILILAAKIQL